MRNILAIALFSTAILASLPANASSDCKASGGQQMTAEQIQAKAESLGYQIRSIEMEDGCFEAKAINPKGARVEIGFDPATGAIVEEKRED